MTSENKVPEITEKLQVKCIVAKCGTVYLLWGLSDIPMQCVNIAICVMDV
jgi:hypothetical protein